MSGTTASHQIKTRSSEIPVWCSYIHSTDSHQADVVALDASSFVLYADKPFQEGTPLFVRVRSFPHESTDRLLESAVRTVSIMEVKWCRKTDQKRPQHTYEIGLTYLQPY